MLNYIWLALILLAVAIGGWNDRWKELTDGAFDGAKTAVTIALSLIGVMAVWLGVMRLAERAGPEAAQPQVAVDAGGAERGHQHLGAERRPQVGGLAHHDPLSRQSVWAMSDPPYLDKIVLKGRTDGARWAAA